MITIATQIPTAAEMKFWNDMPSICVRWDIVVSPPYDCQFVLVTNEVAVFHACVSSTGPRPCAMGSHC